MCPAISLLTVLKYVLDFVTSSLKPVPDTVQAERMKLRSQIIEADGQRLKNLSAVYGRVPPGEGLSSLATCTLSLSLLTVSLCLTVLLLQG
mgnify:CR=1 FL=1